MGSIENWFLEITRAIGTLAGMKEVIQNELLSKSELQSICDKMLVKKRVYIDSNKNIKLEANQYKILLVDCHCEVTLPDSFFGIINIGYNSSVVINTGINCEIVINVATPTSTVRVVNTGDKSKVKINKFQVKNYASV